MCYSRGEGGWETTFPEKLVSLRDRYGLTQKQLAESLGVTRQAVSRWENGTSLPDSVALLRLAEEFDVEPEWLLDEGAAGEPEPRRVRRGRFTMADRAWLIAGAAAVLYLIAYSAVILSDPEGLAVQILQMGGTYRVIMSVQYVNLVLAGPWMRFALAHTAAALLPLRRHAGAAGAALAQARVLALPADIRAHARAIDCAARRGVHARRGAAHALQLPRRELWLHARRRGALRASRRRPPV